MGSNERRRKSTRRQILVFVVLVCLAAWGLMALEARLSEGETIDVHFVNPDGSKSGKFRLQLAVTAGERAKGLMFRKPGELEPHQGMLFVMPSKTVQRFYMKNTYIALDMLFIDSTRKVVGVLHDVPILNEKMRMVPQPSKYVVELLAGEAKKSGIIEGSQLVAEKPLPAAQ